MQKLTEKNTNDRLSTFQIKQGLQKIKRTQIQLLKQLRGQGQAKSPPHNLLINNQNLHIESNIHQSNTYQSSYQKEAQLAGTKTQLASYKKIIQSQKEQVQIKYQKAHQQLLTIQKDYKQLQVQKKQQLQKYRHLERQKLRFQQQNVQFQQKLYQSELQLKRNKTLIEKHIRQKDILEVQIESLKSELINIRSINQKARKQHEQYKLNNGRRQSESSQNQDRRKSVQSPNLINTQKIINQIKKISYNHDRLYDKLKQSTKISMSDLQIQDQIQHSISKLLGYLEKQSQSGKKQNKKSLLEDQQSVIYQKVNKFDSQSFRDDVRRLQRQMMGTQTFKRQITDLKSQNQELRQKIKQMRQDHETIKEEITDSKRLKKYYENNMKSSKIVNAQIDDLKVQVQKLRMYKQRLRTQESQREEELKKYRTKLKQSELKIQVFQREITQFKREAKILQKKLQNSQHQKDDLNQIVKKLNKLNSSQVDITSESHKKLREQFNRIVQSNQLLIRQKQSLKAMNDGLQVQIHNLKYQKDQYQKNNTQKHDLIERQIKQRQNLLQQLQKKSRKFTQRQVQVQNLKIRLQNEENHKLEVRQALEKQLQNKAIEVLALRKQIQNLYKQSRELNQLRFHHDRLQAMFKQQKRKSRQVTETVDHLWAVKQTQYQNVHRILGGFRDQMSK